MCCDLRTGREQNSFAYYAMTNYDQLPQRVAFIPVGEHSYANREGVLAFGLRTDVSFLCAQYLGGKYPTLGARLAPYVRRADDGWSYQYDFNADGALLHS